MHRSQFDLLLYDFSSWTANESRRVVGVFCCPNCNKGQCNLHHCPRSFRRYCSPHFQVLPILPRSRRRGPSLETNCNWICKSRHICNSNGTAAYGTQMVSITVFVAIFVRWSFFPIDIDVVSTPPPSPPLPWGSLKPCVLGSEDPSDSTKDNAAEKCLEETMTYAKNQEIVQPGELCVCLYNLGGGSSTVIKIEQCPPS